MKLLSAKESACSRAFVIESTGGNVWFNGWKKIRKRFGESVVKCSEGSATLKGSKKLFEDGGRIKIEYLRMWKTGGDFLKKLLIGVLKNPKKILDFNSWGLRSTLRLYSVVKDFRRKSTRKYLHRLLSRRIRVRFGLYMSADLTIRVKHDDRLKVVEIRKVVNDGLMRCEIPAAFEERARKKVKIVSTKNRSIGDLIHNQRAFAARQVSIYCCAGKTYPHVEGHVCFRLSNGATHHKILANANDIPRACVADRTSVLGRELREGFANWKNLRGPCPEFDHEHLQRCMVEDGGGNERLTMTDVQKVKKQLGEFVLTPLDRNPGDTLVTCPAVYHSAMMDTFVTSTGYRIVQQTEEEILLRIKEDVDRCGLKRFVRWDSKGEIGCAYVLPKHKDIERFRPICPTFKEPMVKTGRLVAKGLNHLLFHLPIDIHFNLQAVSHLVGRLQRVNRKVKGMKAIGEVRSASYDIKEMFNKLPHSNINEAVSWIIQYHEGKGQSFVRVNTRGKGASFGLTIGADHWRKLELRDIERFIQFELEHTYTSATGFLLRQVVGIPMGKSTSPPLACILCAFAEARFLCSLGKLRKNVFEVRLVDDVVLMTAFLSEKEHGKVCGRTVVIYEMFGLRDYMSDRDFGFVAADTRYGYRHYEVDANGLLVLRLEVGLRYVGDDLRDVAVFVTKVHDDVPNRHVGGGDNLIEKIIRLLLSCVADEHDSHLAGIVE
ncbi:hypothetical protein CBR_g11930 [Chara braunii]|uniref:Reverse transcriptase domain-containing protein n=1 Tax=Chara braunii TaxID=69332 RepID=A0A388KQZ5_CHABU|nr:hypothetical protein CBR_g11930 [Chara braunii]|eukprot:GBG72353.1 hypothetical protein CBR_g11930 [Chara braunii]